MKKILTARALTAVSLTFGSLVGGVNAAIVVDIVQSPDSISIDYSGSVNLSSTLGKDADLGFPTVVGLQVNPSPNSGIGIVYADGVAEYDDYNLSLTTIPSPFGLVSLNNFGGVGSGDPLLLQLALGGTSDGQVWLPDGYTSGTPFSGSIVINNLANVLNEGTYTYVWENGGVSDSATINVSSIPEPSSAFLIGLTCAIGTLRRRRNICVGG